MAAQGPIWVAVHGTKSSPQFGDRLNSAASSYEKLLGTLSVMLFTKTTISNTVL